MLLAAVLLSLLLWWLCWRLYHRRLLDLAARIPGPPGLPLLGNVTLFLGEPHDTFNNIWSYSDEYKDVGKIWLGPRLVVFLTNPLDIEVLLSSKHIDKADEYAFMKPWMGDGLLLSTGKKWYAHRKVIAQTFHVQILRSFMPKFNAHAGRMVERLRREVGHFDVRTYLCHFTAETLLATVMGTEEAGRDCVEYSRNTTRMSRLVHARQCKLYLRPSPVFALSSYGFQQRKALSVIHAFSEKVIGDKRRRGPGAEGGRPSEGEAEDVRREREVASQTGIAFGQASGLRDDLETTASEQGERRRGGAFLDILLERLEQGDTFSLQDVKDQFDTVMFEGHDTTASLTSLFLCMMAVYQDVQEKVYEELRGIFGDSDREVTFQDTLEMKYLERCMMETMRLYSPVPIIARRLNQDLKIVSRGLTLPAGCTVVVAIYKLHRRADLYPFPDRFDPDNFLPERTTARNFYSFIPFSAGLRSCVGRKYAMLKAKTVLATVLRHFRVSTDCPEADWRLQADITLKRTDGCRIRLHPRHQHLPSKPTI